MRGVSSDSSASLRMSEFYGIPPFIQSLTDRQMLYFLLSFVAAEVPLLTGKQEYNFCIAVNNHRTGVNIFR